MPPKTIEGGMSLLTYNNTAKRNLKEYGDRPIKGMYVRRKPIPAMLENLMKFISSGKSHLDYDKYFHLSLICELGGINIILEKNEAVNITTEYTQNTNDSEFMIVPLKDDSLTINKMLDKTIKRFGNREIHFYDATSANCQRFVQYILLSNSLLSPKLDKFIYQSMQNIISNVPNWARKLASIGTTTANIVNRLVGGKVKGNEACGNGNKKSGFLRMMAVKKIDPDLYEKKLSQKQVDAKNKTRANFDIKKPKKITKNLLIRKKQNDLVNIIDAKAVLPNTKGLFSVEELFRVLANGIKKIKKKVSIVENPEDWKFLVMGAYMKTAKKEGKKNTIVGKILGSFDNEKSYKEFLDVFSNLMNEHIYVAFKKKSDIQVKKIDPIKNTSEETFILDDNKLSKTNVMAALKNHLKKDKKMMDEKRLISEEKLTDKLKKDYNAVVNKYKELINEILTIEVEKGKGYKKKEKDMINAVQKEFMSDINELFIIYGIDKDLSYIAKMDNLKFKSYLLKKEYDHEFKSLSDALFGKYDLEFLGEEKPKVKEIEEEKPKVKEIEEEKPKVKEIEEEEENKPIIKIKDENEWLINGQFAYNKTFFDNVMKIYNGKTQHAFMTEIKSLIMNNQQGFDFFPTQPDTIEIIMNDIKENKSVNNFNKVHFLEPSAGLGFIAKQYIENFGGYSKSIEMNEMLPSFTEILKKNFVGVKINQEDFLDIKNKEYDLIIMNPPYSSQMRQKGKNVNDKIYIDHIVTGLGLLSKFGVLYVICPNLHKGNIIKGDTHIDFEENISKSIMKRIEKRNPDLSDGESLKLSYQIEYIGKTKDFYKYEKGGKLTKMQQNFNIYKFISF